MFDHAVIHLPSGKDFTVTASRRSPADHCVKAMELNGRKHTALTIGHDDIMAGGELHFSLKK